MTDIKRCPKCGVHKATPDEFYRNRSTKDGLTSYCRPCHRALNNDVGPRKRLAYNLKSLYNMTIERYEAMEAMQNGRCAICGRIPRGGKNLAVDHDHACCSSARSCGACVRRLLCAQCNHALGLFGDDVERMRRAAEYLDDHR